MYSHALRNIAMQHLVRADHRHHQSDSSSSDLFLLFYLVLIIIFSYASPHGACTQLERDSLLSFLSNLSSTSNNSLLGSWRGTDCCIWEGISCDGNKSVARLWLPFRGLRGQISPALANLTYLSHLNLSHNRLTGTLPPALLWSDHLVMLDVSFNALSGSLSVLPSSSSPPGNHPLQVLNVSSNFITGAFPSLGWGLAHNLVAINASNNSFTGPIPSDVCAELPLLRILDLSRNKFGGSIPPGLGNCSNLLVLQAGFNNLSGPLPDDLFDAISLQQLSLPSNQFSGMLDGERITNLSNLTTLDLGGNQLTGQLPTSICELASLEELLIYRNKLNGSLPSALSNCTKLKSLNLRSNRFTGKLSAINFSRLSNLNMLDLGNNGFNGGIPNSIYLCRSLTALRLSMNKLRGQIAPEMINLQNLSYLSLSSNKLANISSTFEILKSCRNITAILLGGNFKGEAIPDANWFDSFQNLQVLSLASCRLTGQVPPWLAKLEKLEALDLSSNQLTGSIPSWLGSLPHLFYLDMSNNLFSGEFPLGITGLMVLISEQAAAQVGMGYLELPVFVTHTNASDLQYDQLSALPPAIYFQNNSLSGTIPPEISLLRRLLVLDLSHNNFSGEIPVQMGNLTNLEKLNLSWNHLSGMIPSALKDLNFLSSFSVANNDLEGPIPRGGQFDTFPPSSFEGNPKLCGSVLQRRCTSDSGQPLSSSCRRPNKKLIVGITIGICSIGALALTLVVCCSKRHPGKGNNENMTDLDGIPCNSVSELLPCENIKNYILVMLSPSNCDTMDLTFTDILKATNNFDQANIVGCGGFGLVYKATLANGTKLAIKRLSGDMCVIDREFKAEVEALSMAQHENLVSLQGYCICGNFRLLIYSYMENGSLDYWLHERDDGGSVLEWPARMRIAQGASRGLAYIHQICQPHIVHRDIKSSNILLDEEFKAHVADFGLSRLMLPCNTHVTTELVGTLGYIPPEYGQAWVATLRGDMYSFGVVLLELVTGRRPVEILPKLSRELVNWVQQIRCQGKLDEAFDPHLRGKGFEEQMLQVLDVACMCVNQNPFKRPTINEVVSWLENIGSDPLVQR